MDLDLVGDGLRGTSQFFVKVSDVLRNSRHTSTGERTLLAYVPTAVMSAMIADAMLGVLMQQWVKSLSDAPSVRSR